MLERTHIAEAPLVDRRGGRQEARAAELHRHLLSQIPYDEVAHQPVVLPPRVRNPDYQRGPIPPEMYVPARY